MDRARTTRLGLIVYASVTVFLFIYVFPFVFVGYRGHTDGVLAQPTVLDVRSETEYAGLTRAAVWFARQSSVRLGLSLFLPLLMVGVEFVTKEHAWKQDLYCIVMWLALGSFLLTQMGLIALLV